MRDKALMRVGLPILFAQTKAMNKQQHTAAMTGLQFRQGLHPALLINHFHRQGQRVSPFLQFVAEHAIHATMDPTQRHWQMIL